MDKDWDEGKFYSNLEKTDHDVRGTRLETNTKTQKDFPFMTI